MNKNGTVNEKAGRIYALPYCRGRRPCTRIFEYVAGATSFLILTTLLSLSSLANAANEQTFDVLRIGTTTYEKVRVTMNTKRDVFIVHSGGMTNIKVSELPD